MRHKSSPAGWVVSVSSPHDGTTVVEFYDAAIPCVIAAVQAVTDVARAGPDARFEALEGLSSSKIVGLELKPGEARLQ
jgi:hypothetical protein